MTKIELYRRDFCGFCSAASQLLNSKKNITIKTYDIWKQPNLKAEMISRSKGRSTVPQIFINDQHIGGYDDLLALERAGKLDRLLEAKQK